MPADDGNMLVYQDNASQLSSIGQTSVSSQLLTQLTQKGKLSHEKRFVFEVPKRSQRGALRGEPRRLLSLCICA